MNPRRRKFLKTFGLTATLGLSGCQSLLSQNQQTPTETPQQTLQPTDTPIATSTPENTATAEAEERSEEDEDTPTETPENTPEESYSAEDIEKALQDYDQESLILDLNTEQGGTILDEEYNGNIQTNIDLEQAKKQRWMNSNMSDHESVRRFVDAVINYDKEEMENIHNEYVEKKGGNIYGLKEVDLEMFQNSDNDLQTRIVDSGIMDLWYKISFIYHDGANSTLNHLQMPALHEALNKVDEDFDLYIQDHGIPGHGLGMMIQKPAERGENTDKQETYVIETVDNEDQQLAKWENSKYSKKPSEEHPAHQKVDRLEEHTYTRTSADKGEVDIFESIIDGYENLAEDFWRFFRETDSPAMDHLYPMLSAAYIAEENEDIEVDLSEGQLEVYAN